jgi:hypothetical protein
MDYRNSHCPGKAGDPKGCNATATYRYQPRPDADSFNICDREALSVRRFYGASVDTRGFLPQILQKLDGAV